MAAELYNATKPRRYDLTMSRRTRRAANLVVSCQDAKVKTLLLSQCQCQEDVENNTAPEEDQDIRQKTPPQRQCEDMVQRAMQQRLGVEQQAKPHRTDGSPRLSLQELIEEALNSEADDAATRSQEESVLSDADTDADHKVTGATGTGKQRRRVIGMMHRYVKVHIIKAKRATDKNNLAPVP